MKYAIGLLCNSDIFLKSLPKYSNFYLEKLSRNMSTLYYVAIQWDLRESSFYSLTHFQAFYFKILLAYHKWENMKRSNANVFQAVRIIIRYVNIRKWNIILKTLEIGYLEKRCFSVIQSLFISSNCIYCFPPLTIKLTYHVYNHRVRFGSD